MKQVIYLTDGSRVEIDGSNVKHIKADDYVMYDSANRILYGQEQIDYLISRRHANDDSEYDKPDGDWS